MAVGQIGLAGALDVPALDAVCARLEASERARSRAYAEQLEDVLVLDGLLTAAGTEVSSACDLALHLGASEHRAELLLEQAQVLSGLPEGLSTLAEGLLTVEQVATFVGETRRLSGELLVQVWRRVLAQLRAAAATGSMLPPARLATLLRRWVLEAAPADAVERRRRAEADGRVEVRRRDDGLVDLFALGITAPLAHACLSSMAAGCAPVGPDDDRSADKRRLDALVDLLTGQRLPLRGLDGGCSCPAGSSVPCGADVQVLVPLGGALGTTDEPAELVGSGTLDPDLVQRLLLASPRLRAVWVDEAGGPVSTASRVRTPRRGDPADLRVQLLDLAAQVPPRPEPRHPEDHPSGAHPPDTPGPYRVPDRLRRLLTVRRPLCEWPGCGRPARRCDMEHDLAWPDGPTCGCNLGPCCRRHHRVKQTGWTKTRTAAGVVWTSPTGRGWSSPSPHQPPAAPVRPLPALPTPDPTALLTRLEWEDELPPDSPLLEGSADSGRCDDPEPADVDALARRLAWHDTTWTVDLADVQAWQDLPHPQTAGGPCVATALLS